MTFDQASVYVQWEYREWKYQKMSGVGGWLIDSQGFSQVVRSSRVEAIITERRVCTVSVNQWATNKEKQDEEKCGPF